jgi:hypothetical protein
MSATVMFAVNILPGKMAQGIAWATEFNRIGSRILGRPVRHLTAVSGNPSRIAWIVEYENLAHAEETLRKLMQDPDYIKLTGTVGDFLLPGSGHQEIWLGA